MRLLLLATVVLGLCGLSFLRAPAREDIARMEHELRELRTELTAIRARNRELSREAAQLRDNPAAIEKVARHRYSLVRADEWVLPAPTGSGAPAADGSPRSLLREGALQEDRALARSGR